MVESGGKQYPSVGRCRFVSPRTYAMDIVSSWPKVEKIRGEVFPAAHRGVSRRQSTPPVLTEVMGFRACWQLRKEVETKARKTPRAARFLKRPGNKSFRRKRPAVQFLLSTSPPTRPSTGRFDLYVGLDYNWFCFVPATCDPLRCVIRNSMYASRVFPPEQLRASGSWIESFAGGFSTGAYRFAETEASRIFNSSRPKIRQTADNRQMKLDLCIECFTLEPSTYDSHVIPGKIVAIGYFVFRETERLVNRINCFFVSFVSCRNTLKMNVCSLCRCWRRAYKYILTSILI